MAVQWVVAIFAGGMAAGMALAMLLLSARFTRSRKALAEFVRAVQEAAAAKRPLELPPAMPPLLRRAGENLNEALTEAFSRAGQSTETLGANRMLARELKRINALLDAANEGLLAVDVSEKVVFANKGMEAFLAGTPQAALGKPVSECLHIPEAVALLNGHAEETGGRGVRSVELAPSVTGEHYAVYHAEARWESGEPAGALLLFRDISRVKNVQKLQAQFVDSVAHELRTPLTSIRAYVEMLIDDEASDTQMKYNFYNIIYEETYRLSELIDNLLNMSMLDGGTAKLDIAPTRLKRLLEDAIEVIRPQCDKKHIELQVDLPDRLPTLNVDKRLLSMAFMNILSNAAKYTQDHGSVFVTISSHEEEMQITVRDNGMGIAEDEIHQIFDKFYRSKTVESIQGSGVGLATARQIVQLHGGDIRVNSNRGEGSTFMISLPRSLINTSIGE